MAVREIKTIEVERYSEPDERNYVQQLGMKPAREVFDILKAHLEEVGLLPDEYFMLDIHMENEELPEYSEAICHPNWGGSEGIYLDINLEYWDQDEGRHRSVHFATGKTIGESGDDFLRMSRIAAECTMMLNGHGSIVRVTEPDVEVEKVLEKAAEPQNVVEAQPWVDREVMSKLLYNARIAQHVGMEVRSAELFVALDNVWQYARSTVFPVASKQGWLEQAYEVMKKADKDWESMAESLKTRPEFKVDLGFAKLVIEQGNPEYNEVFVGLLTERGDYQDLAVIGQEYSYGENDTVVFKPSVSVKVYGDTAIEDFTHDFSIGLAGEFENPEKVEKADPLLEASEASKDMAQRGAKEPEKDRGDRE